MNKVLQVLVEGSRFVDNSALYLLEGGYYAVSIGGKEINDELESYGSSPVWVLADSDGNSVFGSSDITFLGVENGINGDPMYNSRNTIYYTIDGLYYSQSFEYSANSDYNRDYACSAPEYIPDQCFCDSFTRN